MVCATVGTTSSNAIDPVPEIARICRGHKMWLHVDAAMSGTAALCPEFRHIHAGVELADSYCFNPHKWMFTNFDCDVFYVADRKHLIETLSVLPNTSATKRQSRAPSSITVTGRFHLDAVSAHSSYGL